MFPTRLAAMLLMGALGLPFSIAVAQPAITRLDPALFEGLPVAALRTLRELDCTTPQSFDAERRVNIIRGRFVDRRRRDVAALCSHAGTSRILVIHSKTGRLLKTLAEAPDERYLQTIDGAGTYGYSRRIERPLPRFLRQYIRDAGKPLPELWREGIEDHFLEKASTVHYRHRASWHQVSGRD